MNRNKTYSMLVLAATLVAACSSSEDMTDSLLAGGAEDTAPFSITGTSGNGTVFTDASYGEYKAKVNVPGKWSVTSSKGLTNVYPSSGEGPATVVVQVGENWGAMRENVLTLTTRGAVTRADGDSIAGSDSTDYKLSIVQSGSPALDSISRVFSANKGAGYSYMPGGEYCDGALIQLFNLVTLDSLQQAKGVRLISDVVYPQTTQQVVTSETESGLTKGLMVKASVGMDFSTVKNGNAASGGGSIGVGVGKSHEENSKNKYALKHMTTTQFTREVDYMNIMALMEQAATREEKQKLFSPGFFSVQETFAKDIAAARGNQTRQYDICDRFLSEIGPCFISKSVMGTALDYQISVDSTALRDTLGIKVALEASFQGVIKGKPVDGQATVGLNITEEIAEVLSETTATVKVRGGDVSQVNILVTGGQLYDEQVTAWHNSCRPALAVMVDMQLEPIYVLITDAYAREVLTNYFQLKMGSEN